MMIASSLTPADVTVTYSEPSRLRCKSIDHGVLPSVYDPVISKLSAATSVPVAPLSRLRVVGRPRPNGRSKADSAATMMETTNPVRVRCHVNRSRGCIDTELAEYRHVLV